MKEGKDKGRIERKGKEGMGNEGMIREKEGERGRGGWVIER